MQFSVLASICVSSKRLIINTHTSTPQPTESKKNMGFSMSTWDKKLLKYGELFESKLMALSVNLSLESALDLGWEILADCFEKDETGIKSDLTDEFWPKR